MFSGTPTLGPLISFDLTLISNFGYKAQALKSIHDLKRGCVIFWRGHVGIMIDKLNCIHANAFHMKTKTEPLLQIIERIGKDFNIIKMMDFN